MAFAMDSGQTCQDSLSDLTKDPVGVPNWDSRSSTSVGGFLMIRLGYIRASPPFRAPKK